MTLLCQPTKTVTVQSGQGLSWEPNQSEGLICFGVNVDKRGYVNLYSFPLFACSGRPRSQGTHSVPPFSEFLLTRFPFLSPFFRYFGLKTSSMWVVPFLYHWRSMFSNGTVSRGVLPPIFGGSRPLMSTCPLCRQKQKNVPASWMCCV